MRQIFVNLPVKDLAKSKSFWASLGFGFDQRFTDDNAACLVIEKDRIHAMLLAEPFFKTFLTARTIVDAKKSTEVLIALSCSSDQEVKDLIAKAKAQPGKLNYASTGPGGMPHLAAELLRISAKIDIVHVPYRGAAPVMNDLLGQQVQMVFLDLPVLLPQVRAGKIKPIAIGAKTRAASLPDVPTTGEGGYPQIEAENWYGMVAPAATPRNGINR